METESELEAPKLDIGPVVHLSDNEILLLLRICQEKQSRWPVYTTWLDSILIDESIRRDSAGKIESTMATVPMFTGSEVAECLKASFVFTRYPMTEAQGKLLDHLAMHIVAVATAGLETYLAEQVL